MNYQQRRVERSRLLRLAGRPVTFDTGKIEEMRSDLEGKLSQVIVILESLKGEVKDAVDRIAVSEKAQPEVEPIAGFEGG